MEKFSYLDIVVITVIGLLVFFFSAYWLATHSPNDEI